MTERSPSIEAFLPQSCDELTSRRNVANGVHALSGVERQLQNVSAVVAARIGDGVAYFLRARDLVRLKRSRQADAVTPGNVSSPVVVGFGGRSNFKFFFAGRNAAGEDRIYAVDRDGQLLSYGDGGNPGNVSSPVVVGLGRWLDFKFSSPAGTSPAGTASTQQKRP